MNRKPVSAGDIPKWFLETVRVMQDVERGLRNMETELSHGMRLENLDPGLRDDMQHVLSALGAVKISLSVMDVTARTLLSDLIRPEPPTHRLAAVA